ncbi:Putative LOC100114269 [Caligus rogercresseyi]|uniref:LOC100114269 n=1 Tax=Caligus rogercresseyi TaxID=217165 RepID=A0A7T8HG44_CALRO|nr:Putative LOC100114269 [Caligus rogercresseyi]
MSDLLSPILYVMQNEVDAFWCFVARQASKAHQPRALRYLEMKESGNMYFYFRWILIWFKREFKYRDVMRLWEVLWSGLPGPNFHLILCLSILDGEMCTILENNFGFTEILKHINDMAHNINLDFVLNKAEALHIKIKSSPPEYGVTNDVRDILGLPHVQLPPRPNSKPIPISRAGESPLKDSSRSHNNSNNNNAKEPPTRELRGGNSLDNSSSVEVLSSESYYDDSRFEDNLVFGSSFE